jgi:hypothetical protein
MNMALIEPSFPRPREPSGVDFMHSKALDPRFRGDDGQLMLSLLPRPVLQ